jgi:hypothetical protein
MTEHESTIDLNPAADEIIDDSMAVDDGMFSMFAQSRKNRLPFIAMIGKTQLKRESTEASEHI